MSNLEFSVVGAKAERYAAAPAIALRLRVRETTGARIDAIALRVQIRIEAQRRRYTPDESSLLNDLFGEPSRYADTLKPLLWTHAAQMVLAFDSQTEFDLSIPCSYDFDIASHKYFASLKEGMIPLDLLFSGMIFVDDGDRVHPELVSWSCEARYPLPLAVWREAMDAFFPNSAWMRVGSEVFDELRGFKAASGLPTWDAVMERLLELAKAPRP